MRLLTFLVVCTLTCAVQTAFALAESDSSSAKAVSVTPIIAIQRLCERIEDEAQIDCSKDVQNGNLGCWSGERARSCKYESCVLNSLAAAGCTDWYDGYRYHDEVLRWLVSKGYCSFNCA